MNYREVAARARGAAIPVLSRADDSVWLWVRRSGTRPGSVAGRIAYDTSMALRSAERVARQFPIDPTGL